jgi:hypothetical protein
MRDTLPYHYWASTVSDSWLDVPWGMRRIFLSTNSHSSSVTWSRNRFSSDQWILKFKPRSAKHHANCSGWYRSDNMGRLITLLDFSRFLTVLADDVYEITIVFRTGLVANGIRLTKRCNALSSRCDGCYMWSFTVLVWVCFLTYRLPTV